jgi:hypothetical protein
MANYEVAGRQAVGGGHENAPEEMDVISKHLHPILKNIQWATRMEPLTSKRDNNRVLPFSWVRCS